MLRIFDGLRKRVQEELRLAKLRYPEEHPVLEKAIEEAKDLERRISAANKLLKESLGWSNKKDRE